jgi:hypothetical protein
MSKPAPSVAPENVFRSPQQLRFVQAKQAPSSAAASHAVQTECDTASASQPAAKGPSTAQVNVAFSAKHVM